MLIHQCNVNDVSVLQQTSPADGAGPRSQTQTPVDHLQHLLMQQQVMHKHTCTATPKMSSCFLICCIVCVVDSVSAVEFKLTSETQKRHRYRDVWRHDDITADTHHTAGGTGAADTRSRVSNMNYLLYQNF